MHLDLNSGETTDARAVNPWYAAYTKHQHEKRAADLLSRKGIEVFLPLYREAHRWKDRTQMVSVPLFPCYLFVRTNADQKLEILNTPGVFWLVENGGRACPVPESDIESVQKLVRSCSSVRPHPYLRNGDRVRIRTGALAGIEGILTRTKNQHRVVISVDLLSKSLSVEVDLSVLEPLPSSQTNALPALPVLPAEPKRIATRSI
jgi:transcription elongation factor/antiterminator RfaH